MTKAETEKCPADSTSKEISLIQANSRTTTRTSARHELKLVSTLLKAGGADINETSRGNVEQYSVCKSSK